jgi:hypothetical protein
MPYEAWQLLDSYYGCDRRNSRYEVVRRGAFFDAEKGGIILDRFTELEPAQRCIEERAERPPKTRNRRAEERDPQSA